MLIAVVHGYFLQGTGSNLFVANLCRELCLLGHEVMLFSQEQHPEAFDFVTEFMEFSSDNTVMLPQFQRPLAKGGSCTCYRPNLGGFLPVYVYDKYEGYRVKTYVDASTEEIEEYLSCNTQAMVTAFAGKRPQLVLSNHIVMQPVYTDRAIADHPDVLHYATVHGSCLNFSVRQNLRIEEYARSVLKKVDKLVFVSQFSHSEFMEFFATEPCIKTKAVVIPAGVNLEQFIPLQDSQARSSELEAVASYLEQEGTLRPATYEQSLGDWQWLKEELALVKEQNLWSPDRAAASGLRQIASSNDRLVIYYGKYLWTKGIHLLLTAAPLLLAEHPDTYFVLVGFGSFRYYLEYLVAALHQGRLDLVKDCIEHFRELYPEADAQSVEYFATFLECLKNQNFATKYQRTAQGKIGKRVILTGFLPHQQLSRLIPCADIAVATSIFPEAFGLVALEALASGVVPMQTNHSGFAEIIEHYRIALRSFFPSSKFNRLYLDEKLVMHMAGNMIALLDGYKDMDELVRQELRRSTYEIAASYSWNNMARHYLELYAGKDCERSRGGSNENSDH